MTEIKDALEKILKGENLTLEESKSIFLDIMEGKLNEAQMGALLVALRSKGESPEEIAGAALAMREKSLKVPVESPEDVCDTCGTGGDGKSTFNVSTAVAIAVSATGRAVAKHGNRSISSRTGSADVLGALNVPVELLPEEAGRFIKEKNFAFLFAPLYHPAMKNAMPVRKSLGIRTVFNILGPLTNPAGSKKQIIGVFSAETAEKMFHASQYLNYSRLTVVHGEGGFDEVSPQGKTYLWERKSGRENFFEIAPTQFGFGKHSVEKVQVSSAGESADVIVKVFSMKGTTAQIEFFLLNAGTAFYALDIADSLDSAFSLAEEMLRQKAFLDQLEKLRRTS